MNSEENVALRQRFDRLKGAEHHKNMLIEELLGRLDQLSEDYEQEKLDHARESHFNRDVQLRERQLQNELSNCKAFMERDAFVLVLIDGDGMMFDDHLLEKGRAGGKKAAAVLWNAVHADVSRRVANLSSDYKIVTRIYANLKNLGNLYTRAGIVNDAIMLEEFARGFTGSKELFDFVDVGSGTRACDKISENFKLYLYDCHCRHIFFGCSDDKSYPRLLADVADPIIANCITLLEGVPFDKELAYLQSTFSAVSFEGLFRTSKLNACQAPDGHQRQQMVGLPPPLAAPPVRYQSPYQPAITRTPSASTTSSPPLNPTAATWASTAMAPAPPVQITSPPPTPQTTPLPKTAAIPRNRYGQRVDPVINYDPNELKRIKKLKMCNVHYLRNDCPYDPCTHDHAYKPTKNEMATLRYVSRMTPCKFGTECDDVRCIYGHRCPSDTEGKQGCRFAENCRFEREAHGIDRTVVKMVKVGGK